MLYNSMDTGILHTMTDRIDLAITKSRETIKNRVHMTWKEVFVILDIFNLQLCVDLEYTSFVDVHMCRLLLMQLTLDV